MSGGGCLSDVERFIGNGLIGSFGTMLGGALKGIFQGCFISFEGWRRADTVCAAMVEA
ncbi:hypothetical protein [Bartonella sp. CL266QHHD]|uniref:hypothetical protein n=1 Tax=Bartonella sp. CL266QHHD TaxID=3243519 RepID=UPI0035CEFD14